MAPVSTAVLLILCVLPVAAILLDAAKKVNICAKPALLFLLPVLYNIPVAVNALSRWQPFAGADVYARVLFFIFYGAFSAYVLIKLHIFNIKTEKNLPIRCTIMLGGCVLLFAANYMVIFEIAASFVIYRGASVYLIILNAALSSSGIFLLALNGVLRILFTSKRLGVLKRVMLALFVFIPAVNMIYFIYISRIVHEEYDFARNKKDLAFVRANSDICAVRYPLLLVHGVGFRDLRYFNYWGRIPKELCKNGAKIYYGNQQAFGTVFQNGAEIAARITEIIDETGCEKVNIIAHSKGGLDARYAISSLGMDKYTASLTTVSTPHRGCLFADRILGKMKVKRIDSISRIMDGFFKRIGDTNPDFKTAVNQFTTEYAVDFNERNPDKPGVFYQSYAAVMKNAGSFGLLALPYLLIRKTEDGENDGLVHTGSAKWGEFRGVIRPQKRRGISHGDLIDLKREDIRGFDVCEFYVKIVSELKSRGY